MNVYWRAGLAQARARDHARDRKYFQMEARAINSRRQDQTIVGLECRKFK